jgi:hypothetical protein
MRAAVLGLSLLAMVSSAPALAGMAAPAHPPVWHKPPPPPAIRDVKACGDSRAFFAFVTTFYKDVHQADARHRIQGAQTRALNVQARAMALVVESHPTPRAQMDVCGKLDKLRPR